MFVNCVCVCVCVCLCVCVSVVWILLFISADRMFNFLVVNCMWTQLTVLGTPAEEGGGGKIDLIGSGAFADVDVAMMAHPSQSNLQNPIYLAMTPWVYW